MATKPLNPRLLSDEQSTVQDSYRMTDNFAWRQHGLLAATSLVLLTVLGLSVVLQTRSHSLVAGNSTEAAPPSSERVLPVKTIEVEPVKSYDVSRSFTGEIAALRSSRLGFERTGTLVKVLVEEGSRVSQGQSLARINIQNLEMQRRQLVAQQAQAEARLSELRAGARSEDIAAAEAAVRDLEEQLRLQNVQRTRREFLYEQGAIAREQLDEFTFGTASLQARIDQAKSNLAELRNGNRPQAIKAQHAVVQQLKANVDDIDVKINKSTITAPFSGIIAEKLVDEGTVVGAGQSVLRLSESAAPEVRVGIPVEMVEQLVIGELRQVTLGQKQYQAEVMSILPEVGSGTRTQTVVLALEPEQLTQVTPGQTVRVSLTETIAAEGNWLPISALTQGIRGLWNCFAVVPQSSEVGSGFVIEQQAVEIVHHEGERVLVRGTLQPGDRIVKSGTHRMVPGQRVEPVISNTAFIN